MRSVVDIPAWGVAATFLGGFLTFLGQTTVNRHSAMLSLRVERFEAYLDFLNAAIKNIRLGETAIDFDEKSRKYTGEQEEQTKMYTNAYRAWAEISKSEVLSVLDAIDANEKIQKTESPTAEIRKILNDESKEPTRLGAKLNENEEKLKSLYSDYKRAVDKLPALRVEINEGIEKMDRALVRMQLASPQYLVEMGHDLLKATSERLGLQITSEQLNKKLSRFVAFAKLDLNHPFRARLWSFIRSPRLRKREVVVMPHY